MAGKGGALNTKHPESWLEPEKLLLLECWARDMSFTAVAKKMGISFKTLWVWRNKYPEIENALKKGAEVVDYEVECALLKRALGYKTVETKTIIGQQGKDGNRPIKIEKIEKEVPPDTTAIFGWLNNRRPDKWKKNRDNFIEMSDNESNITVNIIRNDKQKPMVDNNDDDDEWNEVVDEIENEETSEDEWDEAISEFDDDDWE